MIKKWLKFNESFDDEREDFIEDCYIDLVDLGFEFKIFSDSIQGVFTGEISFDKFINEYIYFVNKLKIEFDVKSHKIEFNEKEVRIYVTIIEKNLEGLTDSIKLKLNGKEKVFKIIDINRNMISINKKIYLVSIRFFIKNSDSKGFIDFNVNWELNWKEVNDNVKKYKRAFINPDCDILINDSWFRLTTGRANGQVQIDNENAEKFYQYFKEKGDGWRYGYDDKPHKRVDFTTQLTPEDLSGNWN